MNTTLFEIIISLGDPLGIGPEVTLKAIQTLNLPNTRFCLVGHPHHFDLIPELAPLLKKPHVRFIEVTPKGLTPHSNGWAGALSFESLKRSVEILTNPKTQALVTAPLSKFKVQEVEPGFCGHTEWLCTHYGVTDFAMMLFCAHLKVVLLTHHMALRTIFKNITEAAILQKLNLIHKGLTTWFNIKHPHMAVCGLNPHASDGGIFGDEESQIIIPAIKAFKKAHQGQPITVTGPYSPDSVFHLAKTQSFDAILCHYHDQGLIPIKTLYFDEAVNLTLGLPILRTSPDHGTAFDKAGQNLASEKSMCAAIKAAHQLLGNLYDKN